MPAAVALLSALFLTAGVPSSAVPVEECPVEGSSVEVSDQVRVFGGGADAEPSRTVPRQAFRALQPRPPRRLQVSTAPQGKATPRERRVLRPAAGLRPRPGHTLRHAADGATLSRPARSGAVICWSSLSPPDLSLI